MYYTAIEALPIGILAGNAPFGITYSSPAPPLFATPFITASNGQNQGQPFPVALATGTASAQHPNPNINWSQYEPISGIPGYAATNRIPYVEEYMLSLERQLGANTVLSASYVGAAGAPPSCAGGSQPGQPCALPEPEPAERSGRQVPRLAGPLAKAMYSQQPRTRRSTEPAGRWVLTSAVTPTRRPSGNPITTRSQLSLRHTSGLLELSAGYTYGKSMDDSSNLGEEVNTINPSLSYALVLFRYQAQLRGRATITSSPWRICFVARTVGRKVGKSPGSRISAPVSR